MSVRTLQKSFAGGEVTPEFYGRIDDAKYQTGLAECRNCIVKPHGPIANRPGTQFVGPAMSNSVVCRVIPFIYSTDQTFAVELGAGYFRFHTLGETLLCGTVTAWNSGTAYVQGSLASSGGRNYYCILANTNEVVSNATYWYEMSDPNIFEMPNPYLAADIFSIHYVQSNDVLTLVHPNYPAQALNRLGAVDWTLVPISFVSPLAAPSGAAAAATVATGSGFTTQSYVITALTNTGLVESLPCAAVTCSNNLLTTGNENTISCTAEAGASFYNFYKFSNGLYGFIGQSTTPSIVDTNIIADVSTTPPIQVNPFTSAGNYPSAVGYFQQRKNYGGTTDQPQNVWMTRSGTESDFSYSIPTHDDDGINFQVAATSSNTIRHIVPMASLILLTSAVEYRITSLNSDAITPSSVSATPQSYVGANNVVPAIVNYNVLFAAARGGHLREMAYAWQYSGYITGDLSLRAPHLFDGYELLDMAYAKCPYPIIWAVSSSGLLLSLTYVPEQQIGAWAHHDTNTLAGQSIFESVCVVPEGTEDVVYVVVNRIVGGAVVRYIECFTSFLPNEVLNTCFFVDAGVSYSNPQNITALTAANPIVATVPAHGFTNGQLVDIAGVVGYPPTPGFEQLNGTRVQVAGATTNTFALVDPDTGVNISGIGFYQYVTYRGEGTASGCLSSITSGLSHLIGEKVSVLANGCVYSQQTVTSGGGIALDQPASTITVGLPYDADAQTLPLAFETQAFGQGRMKNVDRAWLRVYNSSGLFAGPSFDDLIEAKQRSTEPFGSPPALVTNEIEIDIDPSWGSNGQLCIRQSDPLPLILTSLTLEVDIGA